MMNYPFIPLDEYYVSPYQTRTSFEQARRRELEGARRRAEMEYYEKKRREELERQARYQLLRKIQQQREEEDIRRRKSEQIRRAEEVEQLMRRQLGSQPKWTILRGPDGRLYRVVFDKDDEMAAKKHRETLEKFVPKPIQHLCSSSDKEGMEQGASDSGKRGSIIELKQTDLSSDKDVDNTSSHHWERNSIKELKPGHRRVAVVVEDASDDENDDETLASVWRNRRPSPGQWIEPVPNYA